MANWSVLKAAVANIINTNGSQAITGQLLQNALNNIITNVGENSTFAGIATVNTNPGAPDGPVFYLATTAGIYPNFNSLEVLEGEAIIFEWDNGTWSKKTTGFATQKKLTNLQKETDEKLSQLGSEVKNLSSIVLKLSVGKYINSTGGIGNAANEYYKATEDYYLANPLTAYRTNVLAKSNYYIAFYDKNKKFLSTIQTSSENDKEWEFITPESTCYVRFSSYTGEDRLYYYSSDINITFHQAIERNTNDIIKNTNDIIKNTDNIEKLTNESKLCATSFLAQTPSGSRYGNIITSFEAGLNELNVSWRAYNIDSDSESTYCFFSTKNTISLDEDRVITLALKNTGNSRKDFTCFISKTNNWGGELSNKHIVVESGETVYVTFDKRDWMSKVENFGIGVDVFCVIELYGYRSIKPTDNGSLNFKVTYNKGYLCSNHSITSENSDKSLMSEKSYQSERSTKSVYSNSAGWQVGAFSYDAVFRDEISEGYKDKYKKGAMTIEQLDERTVRLITNFTSEEVGSMYRGIYWKIKYNSLEDLKGLWVLHNNYTGYNTIKISSAVKDWGASEKDVINLDSQGIGSKKEWNLYRSIVEYRNEQESLGSISKWTGALESQGYLYLVILKYVSDGKYFVFEDTLTLDFVPEFSKVIATELSESLKSEIGLNSSKIQITNWGDSLTAGAGSDKHRHQSEFIQALMDKGFNTGLTETSNITYSVMMQRLLGDRYIVTNCGVGGETINTIASRLGANAAFAKNAFTLPKGTAPVQIGNSEGKLDSSWGIIVSPLLQGAGNSVNPCYVQGIECVLKWTGSNATDTSGVYTIQRVSEGDREISISAKTPIIMSGSKLYRNTKIAVFWCWQNGGYSGNEDLIEKLDKMISHLDTNNYVIVGLHTGNAESRTEQEQLLSAKYGVKFFNWREYVSSNALYDFGITQTKDSDLTQEQINGGVISDESAIREGSLPMSLWRSYIGDDLGSTSNDKTHMTSVGYGILGYKLVELFRNLGYLTD